MKPHRIIALLLASAGLSTAATFWGVTDANELFSFDSSAPGTALSSVQISGLFKSDGVTADPFAVVVNLSYNPTTGQFLGIDTNANVYRVGLDGNATLLNNTFAPAGFTAGLAYDPVSGGFVYADDAADRFNLTNAGTATLIGSAAYDATDVNTGAPATISGFAVDPDFGSAFFLDSALGIIARAYDPDALELFTVGSLGFGITGNSDLGFDSVGNLFASLSTDGVNSSFYSIDQDTGTASMIGSFSQGVGTITIPEPSTALLGAIGMLALLRRRRA